MKLNEPEAVAIVLNEMKDGEYDMKITDEPEGRRIIAMVHKECPEYVITLVMFNGDSIGGELN